MGPVILPATRPDGWELRLAAVVEAARATPFSWGGHDCALWAADVVRAVSGVDVMTSWRGQYSTARGARRFLARLGFGDLAAAVTQCLGRAPVDIRAAGRGDLVVHENGWAVGVSMGRDAMFLGLNGVEAHPTLSCQMAWNI